MGCPDINWNAIAAIGTCLGALASFSTVLFAVLSNKKSNKLMSSQISAMIKQLNYLSEQNYIAKGSLEESRKQTELAKKEFSKSVAELNQNRYKIPEIKIKTIDELNENIKLQNRLLGMICNQLKLQSSDMTKEEFL